MCLLVILSSIDDDVQKTLWTLGGCLHRFNGVVVITLASHARGPGFDPQLNLSTSFYHQQMLTAYGSQPKKNSKQATLRPSTVVVAEWLRRWTRNPLGSSRAGSNPADNATFCYQCFLLIIVCSALLIVFGMDIVISINKNNKISTPTRFELAIF